MAGIKYIGPAFDNSGYAKATRENVLSLLANDVSINLSPLKFEDIQPDLGKDAEVLVKIANDPDVDYDTVFMHCTPEFWKDLREEGKKNIGFTIWETDKLPNGWAKAINENCDALVVGSKWCVDVFKNSGVTVPISAAPHPVQVYDKKDVDALDLGIPKGTYVFYSIFQWLERKDPLNLLLSYWCAFQKDENVALVIKTYRDHYGEDQKQIIRDSIKSFKDMLVLPSFPKVYFVSDLLTNSQIESLHSLGDCYVTLDRGEGFGLSTAQAGGFGNPVIATGCGGATDYLDETTGYPIDYTLYPCNCMREPWRPKYSGDQLWAQVDAKHAMDTLQFVYNNQEAAQEKGKALQDRIQTDFSREVLGKKLKQLIEEA